MTTERKRNIQRQAFLARSAGRDIAEGKAPSTRSARLAYEKASGVRIAPKKAGQDYVGEVLGDDNQRYTIGSAPVGTAPENTGSYERYFPANENKTIGSSDSQRNGQNQLTGDIEDKILTSEEDLSNKIFDGLIDDNAKDLEKDIADIDKVYGARTDQQSEDQAGQQAGTYSQVLAGGGYLGASSSSKGVMVQLAKSQKRQSDLLQLQYTNTLEDARDAAENRDYQLAAQKFDQAQAIRTERRQAQQDFITNMTSREKAKQDRNETMSDLADSIAPAIVASWGDDQATNYEMVETMAQQYGIDPMVLLGTVEDYRFGLNDDSADGADGKLSNKEYGDRVKYWISKGYSDDEAVDQVNWLYGMNRTYRNGEGAILNADGEMGDYITNLGTITSDENGSPLWKWGLDIANDPNTPIYAPSDGSVSEILENDSGFGNQVKIKLEDGQEIWFSHLNETKLSVGDEIRTGSLVGLMGNTGAVMGAGGEELSEDQRLEGRGTHVDITMKDRNGNFLTPKQVQDFLPKQQAAVPRFNKVYTPEQQKVLDELPSYLRDAAELVANYDTDLKIVSIRTGADRAKLANAAKIINPDYDSKKFKAVNNFMTKWADPALTTTKMRVNANTALGHLAELKEISNEIIEAGGGGQNGYLNQVAQWVGKHTGEPSAIKFDYLRSQLSTELATFYANGNVPGKEELNDAKETLNSWFSKRQFDEVFDLITPLLTSKMRSYTEEYKNSVGVYPPDFVIQDYPLSQLRDAGVNITDIIKMMEDQGYDTSEYDNTVVNAPFIQGVLSDDPTGDFLNGLGL